MNILEAFRDNFLTRMLETQCSIERPRSSYASRSRLVGPNGRNEQRDEQDFRDNGGSALGSGCWRPLAGAMRLLQAPRAPSELARFFFFLIKEEQQAASTRSLRGLYSRGLLMQMLSCARARGGICRLRCASLSARLCERTKRENNGTCKMMQRKYFSDEGWKRKT